MKAGAKKRIGSKISFQDGDKFENIKAPERNLKGEEYNCDADKCSLHFHSFTDRSDKLDMFSQNAAVGIVIGVGNVGSDLAPYEKCNTFISRDAGKTFVEVAEHAHMFELGNRGSTVIMVNDEAPTDVVKYVNER